jgi:SPP1 family predicted phage head-tail adaptor
MNQPGQMTEVVTLRAPQQSVDKFGQHTAYATVADVAASVRPLRGREYFAAGAMQSPAELEVEIYWRPDVRGNWRLTWMGTTYDLVGTPIDVDARHATLQLMCRGAAT